MMQPANQHHLGPSAFNLMTDKHSKSERIKVLEDQVSSLKTQLAGFMHTQEALAQEILTLRTQQAETETHRMNLQTENHAYVDKLYQKLDAKHEHFERIMNDRQKIVEEKCIHHDEEMEELRPEVYDMRNYMWELPRQDMKGWIFESKHAVADIKQATSQLKKTEAIFDKELPEMRSTIQHMREYMREFPMRRLQDMHLQELTQKGELEDLKTRVRKVEDKLL